MNEANFCNGFLFNIFRFNHYHFTDLSKKPVPRHYFGCLVKGSAIISSHNRELSIHAGDVFYIPRGLHYQSRWFGDDQDDIEFYSFGFDIAPTKESFVLQKIVCTQKARALFEELCSEIPFTEKGIGKLYRFFGEVADGMEKEDNRNPIVEKAIQYIFENPNERISTVASHCNISESGIYALFKKQLSKTPNELRAEALCEKAIGLLTTTNKSVQEISDTVGFSSTSYFRKVLRKQTGKTPLEIRKESAF